MEEFNFPIDFDDEYYEALGRVAAAFTELEEAMFFSILALTSSAHPRRIGVLVDQIPFSFKINALTNLVEELPLATEEQAELENIRVEIEELRQERNRLMHGYHEPTERSVTGKRRDRKVTRKEWRFDLEMISAGDIEQVAKSMWDLHNRLIAFIHGLYERGAIKDPSGKVKPGFYEKRDL